MDIIQPQTSNLGQKPSNQQHHATPLLKILLLIFSLLIIGVLGYMVYQQNYAVDSTDYSTNNNNDSTTSSVSATEGWKTYTDNTLGFIFKYPSDWEVVDKLEIVSGEEKEILKKKYLAMLLVLPKGQEETRWIIIATNSTLSSFTDDIIKDLKELKNKNEIASLKVEDSTFAINVPSKNITFSDNPMTPTITNTSIYFSKNNVTFGLEEFESTRTDESSSIAKLIIKTFSLTK